MSNSKQNCWEFKKCGREPGGINVESLGICPAATDKRLDGEHDGKNAGRTCWMITSTLCKGEKQGHFGKKYEQCKNCDFFLKVKQEEGSHYKLAATLWGKLGLF